MKDHAAFGDREGPAHSLPHPLVAPLRLALALVVALAVTAVTPGSARAQSECEDLTGVYEVMVNLPGGGPTQIELDLEQTDCVLEGYVGATTRSRIHDGTVSASTATFTFDAPNQGSGETLTIRWEITVEGDEVTGTFSHDLFGSIPVEGSRVGDGTPPAASNES